MVATGAHNAPAGTTCTGAISGVVAGYGGDGSLRFVAQINDPLPSSVVQIVNTALIADDGANGADLAQLHYDDVRRSHWDDTTAKNGLRYTYWLQTVRAIGALGFVVVVGAQ